MILFVKRCLNAFRQYFRNQFCNEKVQVYANMFESCLIDFFKISFAMRTFLTICALSFQFSFCSVLRSCNVLRVIKFERNKISDVLLSARNRFVGILLKWGWFVFKMVRQFWCYASNAIETMASCLNISVLTLLYVLAAFGIFKKLHFCRKIFRSFHPQIYRCYFDVFCTQTFVTPEGYRGKVQWILKVFHLESKQHTIYEKLYKIRSFFINSIADCCCCCCYLYV